ncbi:MAG: hypothetical protein QGF09_11870, partial [Rhodospirillales bacterium]|nr:hypothetical protein [Rhodospirillales bacterium]
MVKPPGEALGGGWGFKLIAYHPIEPIAPAVTGLIAPLLIAGAGVHPADRIRLIAVEVRLYIPAGQTLNYLSF